MVPLNGNLVFVGLWIRRYSGKGKRMLANAVEVLAKWRNAGETQTAMSGSFAKGCS